MTGSFLEEPPVSALVQALYDEDLADGGYVQNMSRLWAHQPGTLEQLFGLMSEAFTPSGLSFRQRGILVTAAASALGDSYCSLAWGGKLGTASDATIAAGVLNGQRRRADGPGEGDGRVGPEGRQGPERDDAVRHPGAPRLRPR